MKWADVTDADLIGALNVVTHAHDPVVAKSLIAGTPVISGDMTR